MPLVPLDIPAGVVRHGTDSESAGRWRDANFVRWRNGSLRPIGGWAQRENRAVTNNVQTTTVGVTLGANKTARSATSWKTNTGTLWLAAGTYNNLYSINEAGTVASIMPSGSDVAGALDGAVSNLGYGQYYYGKGLYGKERPVDGALSDGDSWSLDSYGENLVAVNSKDGIIRQWTTTGTADALTNAPSNNDALVVTEDRFVFALGAGNNPRKVQWCDREDNTVWTPAATNEAGDIILDTNGKIQLGLQVRGRTLLITDVDAHVATYSGPPVVFSFEKVGDGCGAISRHCAVAVGQGAYYMGQSSFFYYNGQIVVDLLCEVEDYVFKEMNRAQRGKVYAVHNNKFNEVWWFYPSNNGNENDRYVVYDYKENHWNIGQLDRTAAVDAGVQKDPVWFAPDGKVYNHEKNYIHIPLAADGTSLIAFAETGPIEAGAGDNVINVTKVIPDHKAIGPYKLIFKTRDYPNSTETAKGPFDAVSPTNARFQGRQIRMRIDPQNKEINKMDSALVKPNNMSEQDALENGYSLSTVAAEILLAAVRNTSSILYGVELGGRNIADINGDGAVTSADSFAYMAVINNTADAKQIDKEYVNNVLHPYLEANYPATASVFVLKANTEDWTLGTVKLETKLGGAR